ncbi:MULTISPECIES: ABC transporter permease [unclassified Sinorhizobium]|uniref:ABC transporter permease n=1 Tax=unclassified Sinorhizobium TaxID=2613772 RepID=UPI0035250A66
MSTTEAQGSMTSSASRSERTTWSMPSWMITTISIIIALAIWEYFGRNANPLLGTYPSAIFAAFIDMLKDGRLLKAFVESSQPFAAGYIAAAIIGIPVGLLLGRYRFLEAAFGIYITAGYATPLIALVPLMILWFGLGFMVKAVIVFLLSFFPICLNTWFGVKAVPKTLVEVGTAFCAPQTQIMRGIVLPATTPYIMAGLRLGIGKAVIGIVIAEFQTAISGLGGIIITSANAFRTAEMFVPVILIMVVAVVLTALVGWLEKVVAPWQSEITGQDAP